MRDDNVQLVTEILDSLNNLQQKDAAIAELAKILQEPHFKVSYTSFLLYTVIAGFKGCENTRNLLTERSSLWSTLVGTDVGAFTPTVIFSEVPAAQEVRQPCCLVALYILDHLEAATCECGGVFSWANSSLSYVGKVRGRILCHLLFQ